MTATEPAIEVSGSASYVLSLAVAFGIGTAVGQQAPPKENKGLAVEKTATIDLGGEIEGVQGRQTGGRIRSSGNPHRAS